MVLTRKIKKVIRVLIDLQFAVVFVLVLPFLLLYFGVTKQRARNKKLRKPRLIFGTTPIISMAYIASSLKDFGYESHSVVVGESSIYPPSTFDVTLMPNKNLSLGVRHILLHARCYLFFIKSLFNYDIYHYYFDGGLLRYSLFNKLELSILKLCGKKVVLLPYGGDAFVYDLISNPIWRHGLMLEYAQNGNEAKRLQNSIRKQSTKADVVIACLVHFVNLPRWDVLPLTCYPVDTHKFQPVPYNTGPTIKVVHASNHRGIKGTVFLIAAVQRLQQEGHAIELDIIEKAPNTEAIARMAKCDIYVDQLIFGYAQAALEAMALGKVVISAILNTPEYDLFRNFSYLNECPIISASVSSIYDVLKSVISQQQHWAEIGAKSREYVEKRHSFKACSKLYHAIYRRIWYNDKDVDLINFYHPLLEQKHESSASSQ